jgi:hypothetical protein
MSAHAIVRTDPARQDDAIDLNKVAQEEYRLATARLEDLVSEHDELCRWLDLPFAGMWSAQHEAKSARVRVVWSTIKRRFPEYAAKRGRA